MRRRDFLKTAGAVSAGAAWPRRARAAAWRSFEVTTRVEVLKPDGMTRVWVPAALIRETPYQKTLDNTFHFEGGSVKIVEHKPDAMGIIVAEFPAGVKPVLTTVSRVSTRDWTASPTSGAVANLSGAAELKYFLRSTRYLPTDGIVRDTASQITAKAGPHAAMANAIYNWIVENTFRDPKTRGCGLGNIRAMLETRDLGGKCADLNALFVGLARAAGIPARDVYGIRVAPSQLGYRSLGASSDHVTKSQHCRAEVYLEDYGGWVPVDPADVRKVMLEEPPGNRQPDDEMVEKARARLFGFWEMNWMAYNFAHDVALPGSSGPPIPFFMYPQAETGAGRIDSLDPDTFRYEIISREIA